MTVRYLISVRNIPWTVSHSELEHYFSSFGMIKYAKVIFDKCGLSTGYGFVEFYDKIAMNKVLCKVHILEEEELFVTKGVKYLVEGGVEHFVKGYIKNFNSNIQGCHITNYTEDEYIQEQYRNVKLNKNRNCDDVSSVIKQFLKHKHT